MTLITCAGIAMLFGCGAYLLLKQDLIRVVLGMVLISHAAVLFVMSARLSAGEPPMYPLPFSGRVSDPLVQAMALTAIVIGFAVTALLLAIVFRVYLAHRSLDLGSLAAAEERLVASEETGPVEPDRLVDDDPALASG